jgi:hypothetical protein
VRGLGKKGENRGLGTSRLALLLGRPRSEGESGVTGDGVRGQAVRRSISDSRAATPRSSRRGRGGRGGLQRGGGMG